MKYVFDKITPRRATNSYKWDMAHNDDVLPMWVADVYIKKGIFHYFATIIADGREKTIINRGLYQNAVSRNGECLDNG